jgi:short-subunit dehydrogenase
MKVLITGTSGGFGQHLVRAFSEHEIIKYRRGDPMHKCDVLINNGWNNKGGEFESALQAIRLCQEFKSKNKGIIININSVAGLIGSKDEDIYAASKWALRGFTESVKEAWRVEGVHIIDVYPGAMNTGMAADRPGSLIDAKELATFIETLIHPKSFFVKDITIRRI